MKQVMSLAALLGAAWLVSGCGGGGGADAAVANTTTPTVPVPATSIAPVNLAIYGPAVLATGAIAKFQNNLPASETQGLQYDWDLGDGTRSTEASPSRAYAVQGNYQITLTVRNQADETRKSTRSIWVGRYSEYNGVTCSKPGRAGWCRINPATETMSMFFLDNALGWALDDGGLMYTTADGGATWAAGYSGIGDTAFNNGKIAFADALTGWALGTDKVTGAGNLYKTSNGGLTWQRQRPNADIAVAGTAMVANSPGRVALFTKVFGFPQILSTSDGGTTWSLSTLDPSKYSFDPAFATNFVSGNTRRTEANFVGVIWAVDTMANTIVKSTDLGRTLDVAFRPSETLKSVSFVDGLRGWALGLQTATDAPSKPVLWATTDAGATWTKLDGTGLPLATDPKGLALAQFTNVNTGWLDLSPNLSDSASIAQYRPLQFRSTDGGKSWSQLSFPGSVGSNNGPLRIFSANLALTRPITRNTAMGGVPSQGAHTTLDGGTNWALLPSPWAADAIAAPIIGLGGTRLLLESQATSRERYISADGGLSWALPFAMLPKGTAPLASLDAPPYISGVWAVSQKRWLAVVGAFTNGVNPVPTAIETVDGGKSWQASVEARLRSLTARMQFLSEQVGLRLQSDELDRTTDGGKSWSIVSGSPFSNYGWPNFDRSSRTATGGDMDFVDETMGYLIQESGLVAKTTNGGSDWTVQGLPIRPQSVRFLNRLSGIVVGNAGGIATTADGGVTWVSRTSGTTQQLLRAHWASASVVVAYGAGSTIIRSIDGGVSWSAVPSPVSSDFKDMAFADEKRGWIVGSGGVLATTDGGASWVTQDYGVTDSLIAVHKTDTGNARIFGRNGSIYLTETGGF